jgi:dTDP-N-acetylfucosamine:lipid II N-acetylfucosaminyltransferase
MNYHFFIDEKFVDDFVNDAAALVQGQRFILTCENAPQHAKNHLLERIPLSSDEITHVFKIIKETDNVYVHWFSIDLNRFLKKLSPKVKIYLMFMGGDFLQSNFPQSKKLSIDVKIFDKLSRKEVEKIYNRNLVKNYTLKINTAWSSNNWRNIIHTYVKSILYYVHYKSGKLFSEEYKQRKEFLNRITAVCHWNPFDIELIENFYNVKLKTLFFMYSVGLSEAENFVKEHIRQSDSMKIWLGNSDTVTNNHLDALQALRRFKNENIEIICPLNYGNKLYGDIVEELGRSIFGNKFVAIRDFISRDEYYQLMDQTSVVIMYHKRGQAGGNIMAFLLKKKKVFIKSESSIYKFFKSLGVQLFDANQISKLDFKEFSRPLSAESLEMNSSIIRQSMNNEVFRIESLRLILEGKH